MTASLPTKNRSAALAPRDPLPRASSGHFSERLRWAEGTPFVRSQFGVTSGVYFCDFEDERAVVKPNVDAQGELLATSLAKLAGIKVPNLHLERHNAPYLRRALGQPQDCPILVMNRVEGKDFYSLSARERRDLTPQSPRFGALMADLGRICALDCFIGNFDRTGIANLGSANAHNLMLSAEGVVAIDSTPCTPYLSRDVAWRKRVNRAFAEAIASCDPQERYTKYEKVHAPLLDCLKVAAWVSWHDIRKPYLAGFREGAAALAQLTPAGLDHQLAASARYLPAHDPSLGSFLHANLSALHRAAGLGLIGLPRALPKEPPERRGERERL